MSAEKLPPAARIDTSPIDFFDDGPSMLAAFSVLIVISTIFVALRFWAKRLSGISWQTDDWLCLSSLVIHHGSMVSGYVQIIQGGLGRDIRLVVMEDQTSLVILFKALFASELIYAISSTLVKLSVLAFYWRIFPTTTVRWGSYFLVPAASSFLASGTTGTALNHMHRYPAILWDVLRLNMKLSKKIGVAAVFLLGSLAFLTSLARAITSGLQYRDGDINFTKQFVVPGITSVVEIHMAIIGACLPTIIPVYRRLRYGDAKARSGNSEISTPNHTRGAGQPSKSSKVHGHPHPFIETGYDDSFERLYHDSIE
ncbi:hypothetical protein B0I35DRAFT_484909 [Stachybotrys elegans]|uniref:Rhodopsin domain-containing protein n=1 Tax=Stachybotrys elegans TaxID=80388 RepID=A0A8K0WJD4_9HYPO|nr:hypothetical protein B0I35DRAFT_484909 [Stachybotrys elegans]